MRKKLLKEIKALEKELALHNYGGSKLKGNDKRSKRWRKQRRKRGFDDRELFNLDMSFSKHILPRLKRFKKRDIGCPNYFVTRGGVKAWEHVLDLMIAGFQMTLNDLPNIKERKIIRRGLRYFAKFYTNLWI